jgi:hypothetical protein
MFSIAMVSIIILAFLYGRTLRTMLTFVGWVTASNRHLAIFVAVIFVVPVILMLF